MQQQTQQPENLTGELLAWATLDELIEYTEALELELAEAKRQLTAQAA